MVSFRKSTLCLHGQKEYVYNNSLSTTQRSLMQNSSIVFHRLLNVVDKENTLLTHCCGRKVYHRVAAIVYKRAKKQNVRAESSAPITSFFYYSVIWILLSWALMSRLVASSSRTVHRTAPSSSSCPCPVWVVASMSSFPIN